tara:strand:+ start:414 stop:839 length:426 start_codon:yes stop_codon:yes gene_type:complete
MITFIVTKDDNTKTIQFSNDGTMLDLKKEIIKLFELDCEYIDIISNVERPIRVLGKFNFDKGLQPRTLDNYPFNRFGIDERTIPISFSEEKNYLPIIKKSSTNSSSSSKYIPPNGQSLDVEDKPKVAKFNIESEIDFPSLC